MARRDRRRHRHPSTGCWSRSNRPESLARTREQLTGSGLRRQARRTPAALAPDENHNALSDGCGRGHRAAGRAPLGPARPRQPAARRIGGPLARRTASRTAVAWAFGRRRGDRERSSPSAGWEPDGADPRPRRRRPAGPPGPPARPQLDWTSLSRAAGPGRRSGRAGARTARTASSTPGMNDARSYESCRIVSVSPGVPNSTSWCATRPVARTECTRTPSTSAPRAPATSSLVASGIGPHAGRGPRRGDHLGGAQRRCRWARRPCSGGACSMISTDSKNRAARAANSIISTAPTAKFGRDRPRRGRACGVSQRAHPVEPRPG